jgi:hypothetical protein
VSKLLLVSDEEDLFLRKAIEAWSAVYAGDSDIDEHRGNRWNILRKLDGKYTDAEREKRGWDCCARDDDVTAPL